METKSKNQWQVRGAAVSLFLLGFLAGALSLNYYRIRHPAVASAGAGARFSQLLDRLNLRPEQRTEVEKILSLSRTQLADVRKQSEPRVREIRQQTDAQLQAVLTPEQWQQWQQLTEDFRTRRRSREP